MELEMWKLSEEEAYREQLRSKEVAYLSKLGEEWRKREVERQKIFTQKVALFCSCTYQVVYCLRLSCVYIHAYVHVCKCIYMHTYTIWMCDPHIPKLMYIHVSTMTGRELQCFGEEAAECPSSYSTASPATCCQRNWGTLYMCTCIFIVKVQFTCRQVRVQACTCR